MLAMLVITAAALALTDEDRQRLERMAPFDLAAPTYSAPGETVVAPSTRARTPAQGRQIKAAEWTPGQPEWYTC